MEEIEDCRKKKSTYAIAELLTACLAMFLFKAESRNGLNNLREDLRFEKNYQRLFKMRLPHMDQVFAAVAIPCIAAKRKAPFYRQRY